MPDRIAVIGGVASGPAAAAQAKRTAPDAEVVLFEQGEHIAYGACEIPYLIGGRIEGPVEELVVVAPEEYERTRGAVVRTRQRVEALDADRRHLIVRDLATGLAHDERFDTIILATGAHARRPGIDGEDAPNVIPVRRLADAARIQAYLGAHAVRHVVVLGGGYIGLEMAEALRERGLRVTVLEPTGRVLNRYLDDPLRPLVADAIRGRGVLVRAERATAFETDTRGHVSIVHTDGGEQIGCQLVLLALGVAPTVALAEGAGLRLGSSGAIATDAHMRTSRPALWACGDCAEVERVVDEAPIHWPLAPTGFRTARVAGTNAARRGRGAAARFAGVTGASAVCLFGLEVASVGLRLEEARAAGFDAVAHQIQHWSRVRIYPGTQPLHVRLVADRSTGRLLGGELVGAEGAALRLNVLIPILRGRGTLGDVQDLDLVYNPPLAPSLDPLFIAAHETQKRLRVP